jgi:hypothetical protein
VGGHTPSVFANSFKGQKQNSLSYNAAQKGSPIAVVYGTQRVPVNVIAGFGFTSTGKGRKSGGKGGSKSSKKGGPQYSVNGAFALCQGPVAFTGSPYAADGANRVWSNGGVATAASLPLNYYTGEDGQAPDPVFESSSDDPPILGYSGTAYVTATPMQLGSTPVLPNIQVEVTGFGGGTAGTDFLGEVRPDWIVVDMLCNERYGVGVAIEDLDTAGAWAAGGTVANWGEYCQSIGIAMSLLMDRQQPAAHWVQEIVEQTCSAIFESGGQIKIVPYFTTALSGNGSSWSPILTSRYDLDDDDFIDFGGGSDPVVLTRNDGAQIANWINAEYDNATGEYNKEIIPVFDQGAIDSYGLNVEASYTTSCITNSVSAQLSAQLRLDRALQIRDKYKFKLGWRHSLLEQMDIVRLSDTGLGLSLLPVRVIEIAEDDNGELTVTAEQLAGSEAVTRTTDARLGAPPLYDRGLSRGVPLYDPTVDPGDANPPVIFEPPPALSNGLNEAWIVATGAEHWGGCLVWLSTDGTSYAHGATLYAGGRSGVLAASLPSAGDPDTASVLRVDLSECEGELLSATQADADNYITLCWVGGELLSYRTATLTAAAAYDLTYLRRGAYGAPIVAHSAGTRFARVGPNDSQSIWRYRYPSNLVGTTVYVKLQSFNEFGSQLQDSADLPAYPYTLTGAGSVGVGGPDVSAVALGCLDADPATGPGSGVAILYALQGPGGTARLRMQAGTSAAAVDVAVAVGAGFAGTGASVLSLGCLDADPAAPGAGRAMLYAVAGAGGTAVLRMMAGTDPTPVEIAVNVGAGFGGGVAAALTLSARDADPGPPGAGLAILYAVRALDGTARLRMQAGTSAAAVDVAVAVGAGF